MAPTGTVPVGSKSTEQAPDAIDAPWAGGDAEFRKPLLPHAPEKSIAHPPPNGISFCPIDQWYGVQLLKSEPQPFSMPLTPANAVACVMRALTAVSGVVRAASE